MKRLCGILLALAGLFLYAPCAAQNTRVRGTVTDAQTGEPIPYAVVLFPGTTTGITTDDEGFYSLESRDTSSYIRAEMVSYEPQIRPVHVGGYNFSITGNAFKGSSEPGIVYVMQDTNGNTLPDDEWYELKGSEYGKEETVQDYAVTYYRPTYSGADVQWKDNQGVKGKIDYLKQYHDQPSYYPAWIGTDSYTLYGPCLKSRTYDQSGNGSYWVNGEYDWGYADNFGNDRLSEDDNAAAGAMKVYFKISNAVDKNGQPANLKYIDFIRVQTGVNAKAGWLGENSTEVFGFTDENINQGK